MNYAYKVMIQCDIIISYESELETMHLSDIKYWMRCPKYLWLNHHEPQKYQSFVHYHLHLSDLLIEYYSLQNPFIGAPNDPNEWTMQKLDVHDALLYPRFETGGIRIKVPLMIKQGQAWKIIFTSLACHPRESEAQKIADTIQVLKALHIPIADVSLLHLNENYVRGNTLDVHQLFHETTYLYNKKNHPHHSIQELIQACKRNVFDYVDEIESIIRQSDCPNQSQGPQCMKQGKCPYYTHCFPEPFTDTSVHYLMQTGGKYDLEKGGYDDMRTIDVSVLEGNRLQYAQLMAARNNGFFIDRFAVKSWIKNNIQYPISYLDFEWDTFVYPPYERMRPFDVITFQYSLHIEDAPETPLRHEEFLGQGDCRIAFIEHLLAHIPKEGSILVYNMEGAEKLRLIQLSKQFPIYKKKLDSLCNRMVDLSLPFETGSIYDIRMKGLYSLKKLVEIFSEHDYHKLAVSYGLEAVIKWRELSETNNAEEIKQQLLEYCALDSYAEYIVFHKIGQWLEEEISM